MKKYLLAFLLLFGLPFREAWSQMAPHDGCASDAMWQMLQARDPKVAARQAALDRDIARRQAMGMLLRSTGTATTRTIPVVVHIIHNGGAENISNTMVQQGIQDLNDAFHNVGAYDPLTGVDTEIQFCLASQDPNGAGTTGIVRVQSALTNVVMETQDISLKNLSRWDPTKYLNIWLVAEITSQSMGSGVAGYAYFPSSHGQPEDGIVNEARWFGSSHDNSKIHVHEAGHYLGLYHTFQGGCTNNNCLTDGDHVCDTPPDNSTAATVCTSNLNTCSTDDDDLSANNPFRPIGNGGLGDQVDMIMNYMDYGFQTCQSAFTQGQKDRMTASLTGPRASLLTSLGCASPCQNTITASFTPSATNVTAGTLITFSNNSTGATTWDWQRNGISFSSSANPTWIPNAAGTYTITLVASNGDPSCTRSQSVVITVTCQEQAAFTASASTIAVGGSITFTNTSTGPTPTFEWLIDGVSVANTTHFTHTFPAAGGYLVQLVQQGSNCSDTTSGWYVTVGVCAPKNGNHWYFGHRAGIDFSSGTAVPDNNGNNSMYATEGSTTLSDAQGNLLFYTDGNNLYNRLHLPMPNGDSLGGGWSCAQGSLAIPKPGSTTQYYLFSQAHFAGALNDGDGLYAALIDMTLDNGNGDVVWKRDTLMRPATERLTAVNHCNGRDVWVINHEYGTDAYYAFLVTPTGIQPPVITHIGWVIAGGFNNTTAIGSMKATPDGKRIAGVVDVHFPKLELFDFDNRTGILSNPYEIVNAQLTQPYGIEFSPDGSRLYITNAGEPNGAPANVLQYDMTAGSYAAIEASQTQVSGTGVSWGTLQLGPNGKIYMARYETALSNYYVGVIDNPNALGFACNFNPNGLYLGTIGSSSIGLAQFNQSYFTTTTPEIEGPDTVCAHSQGITFRRPSNNCSGGGTISYQVAGDAQILSSTDTTVTLSFGNPGNVTLTILENATCGSGAGNMNITVVPSDTTLYLGPDVVACSGANVTLDAGAGYASYLWNTGANTQTINVGSAGTYWCEVSGASNCRPRDSVDVTQVSTVLSVSLGPDPTICSGQVATLDAGPGYGSYLWQDGSTNQTFTAWFAGNYSVTVTGTQCAGTASDTALVFHSQPAQVNLGNDTVLCSGSTITLQGPNNGGPYLWQDGSTNQNFTVTQPGTYWVSTWTIAGCASADTVEIGNCVASADPLSGMTVQIWPNPAGEVLHLRLEATRRPGHLRVQLWDVTGKELMAMRPEWIGNRMEGSLDLHSLANGLYFLRIETDKGSYLQKVERIGR